MLISIGSLEIYLESYETIVQYHRTMPIHAEKFSDKTFVSETQSKFIRKLSNLAKVEMFPL